MRARSTSAGCADRAGSRTTPRGAGASVAIVFGYGPGCDDGFIAANFDSPLSLLMPQLARLAAIGGFRRWDRMVRRFVTDERLLRVFTFQALYAGVPPHRALAVYAVIAYMDTVAGVYFPRGGIRALPMRSPRPRPMPVSSSITARLFPRWTASTAALPECARILVIGFRRTRWC